MPTPAIVPPVPAAQVKPSIRPSSCSQISGAVPSIWARRLAILSNWLAQIAPSASPRPGGGWCGRSGWDRRTWSAARATSSAPSARSVSIFSLRLVVGHDDDRLVAQRIGDQRDADAGIARRALDHGAAGLQFAARLGIAHDPQRGAVLHRWRRDWRIRTCPRSRSPPPRSAPRAGRAACCRSDRACWYERAGAVMAYRVRTRRASAQRNAIALDRAKLNLPRRSAPSARRVRR